MPQDPPDVPESLNGKKFDRRENIGSVRNEFVGDVTLVRIQTRRRTTKHVVIPGAESIDVSGVQGRPNSRIVPESRQ